MKNKIFKIIFRILEFIIVYFFMGVLYIAYIPWAIVRVFVDMDNFGDFLNQVGDYIQKVKGWFHKN